MVVSFHVKTTVLRGLFPTSGVAGVCRLNSHAGPHGYTRSDSHIRACRDSTPAPTPTVAGTVLPVPTATLAPTPTSAPAATPTPAPTPTATPPVDDGDRKADSASALSPLDTTDPRAFLSGVSDAEQACLSGQIDPRRLMLVVGTPELAKEEDRAILIGCLEHETLLRLFLTPVLDQAGPLSVESSACIRDAFADADLAALITAAGAGADEGSEAAMVGAMTGLFAILSCLSTDEFQAAGPALGMGPDDYQGFKCVLDALGGPEELAALMQPDAGPSSYVLQRGNGLQPATVRRTP